MDSDGTPSINLTLERDGKTVGSVTVRMTGETFECDECGARVAKVVRLQSETREAHYCMCGPCCMKFCSDIKTTWGVGEKFLDLVEAVADGIEKEDANEH